MSDNLKHIWPEWEIVKQIGRGSYGVVYKAVRKEFDFVSEAAIKVITIPSDSSELDSLRSEGLDFNASRTYLQEIVKDFINEIRVMESVKATPNVVSIEDYRAVEKTDELGWDIYIRMELLTPFNSYICDKTLSEEEVIKLGVDVCGALEICGKRNIIHRDIKPENIFINDFGTFKLGDFGIARKLENMTGGFSQKGTINYMAPEVAKGTDYDARVDIYSLGIVLYRLLNKNHLPFLDTEKQLLSPIDRKNAIDRRMHGEALPPPYQASPAMAQLILKACAYEPGQRFASAEEMKNALLKISGVSQSSVFDSTASVRKPLEQTDERKPQPYSSEVFGEPRYIPQEQSHSEVTEKVHQTPDHKQNVNVMQQPVDSTERIRQVPGATSATEAIRKKPQKHNNATEQVRPPVSGQEYLQEDTHSFTEAASHTEPVKTESCGAEKKFVIPIISIFLLLCAIGIPIIIWGMQPDYIELASTAYRKEYYVGDELQTRDIVLNVVNKFGQTQRIKDGYTCYPKLFLSAGKETIKVTYDEMTTSFDVNVSKVELSSLTVESNPSDTSYYVGETLDTSGLTLKAKYNNYTTKTIASGFECSPTELSSAGTQKITVTYEGQSTSFDVNVIATELISLSVKSNPTDTSYFVGETLNTSGLTLTAKYDDGTTKTINSGFTCSPTALSTTGTQKITVTYGGKSTSFNVEVTAVELSSISVASNPNVTSYFVGETLNTSGLTLTAKYNDSTTKTVSNGFICSPAKMSTAGTQEITVTYGSKSTTFNVNVSVHQEGIVEDVIAYVNEEGEWIQVRTLESISINTMPTKTSYSFEKSAVLDTTGLTLTAKYDDGTIGTIKSGFTCTPMTISESGTHKITVSYEGFTTSFTITASRAEKVAIYERIIDGAISDISNHWAKSYIENALADNNLYGWKMDNGTYVFNPDDFITRAEYIQILNDMFDLTSTTEIQYDDVPKNAWYYEHFAKAAADGYLLNYGSSVDPDGYITKEEAVALLVRLLKIEKDPDILFDYHYFEDWEDINPSSRDYVLIAIVNGYITGTLNENNKVEYKPKECITRAEALVAISRAKNHQMQ